jgi:two-component system cell cycle sensor histidine kinase/response regulator CckA
MTKNAQSKISNLNPLRVLMVEDSEDDALLVLRELKKGGYNPEYERVETAAAMRKALQDKTWDVILCDYHLPGFNGIEAIVVLRETNIDIPLLIVSGAIVEEMAVECMRLGAHDYVMKGNLSRLVPAIERELKEAESRAQRKQAEEELHRTNVFLGLIVENIPSMIFLKDAKELRYVRFNRAGEDLLGHSMDDMLGKNDYDFFPKEQANFFTEKDREVLHGKEVVDIPEERIQTRNKGERIMHTKMLPILNENGEPEYLLGISEDITERKQAEESLRKSEEKYRNILENIDDGYFEVDIAGNFIFFNDSMCKMLGYPKDELMGMNNREYMDEENTKKVFQAFNKIYRTGISAKAFDWTLIRKDGSKCFVETVVSPIIGSNGKGIGFRGIARDISDRKKLEAQLHQSQKMESIGTLAGGIAHDFNNILSSIIGFTELALDDVDKGSPLEENLQEVFTAGIRAKDLVQQILTLSRHDAVDFKPIHINSVAKEAVKMLRSIIPTSINIQENICNKQLVVQADPTQIHQVIVNLATNAKHAMSETGGVMLVDVDTVSFDESTENINLTPGNYARITVSDTGTGINKDHLEKIFEPYFTTKAVGEGSGLGLSVVHGIIKSHKGDIAVYSEPGKGTKSHVYLPLSEQQSIELPDTNTDPLPRGTERILLVDDEPSIVKMQQRSLERLGYKVTIKTSSVDTLETFCATPDKYDLVITDMTMPDMTGDKLADEIKKIRHDVPVILCTGFSDKIKIRTGPDLQIDEFISKPIDQKKLAKIIRKLLDKAKN